MSEALETVISGGADYWLKRRGIDREFIQRSPILGFMRQARFSQWRHTVENCWAILVQDPDEAPRGVKLHLENPPPGSSKSLWAPFGTQPTEKPRHMYATLWPCPEWLPPDEWLILCPGELKAAAFRTAGIAATSITAGESHKWTPGQVARFRGRKVMVIFDDDPAGHKFRDNTLEALSGLALELKSDTFGRKTIGADMEIAA